jgi:hypothetical protein
VLSVLPKVSFVIVGEGGMREQLAKEAWDFGVAHHVFFAGFVDEKTLVSIYRAGDVAVVPSLYEPFGITALEAMAAKTPVVVSDTGGLAEIVEHDKTGVKTYPDNSDSLAWGILRVLQNPAYATMIEKNAYEKVVKDYDWDRIADETIGVYHEAMAATPVPDLKLGASFPLLKLEGYPEELRVLVLLHVLGATDRQRAILRRELLSVLRISVEKLRVLLQRLVDLGYLEAFRDSYRRLRYYLTGQGIIKACSLFS